VVVYRVGDGTTALVNTGSPVFIDQYSSTGLLQRTTPMPTATNGTNHRLIASGVATSEGLITRTIDGHFVLATGYDAAMPTTGGVAGTAALTVPRVIGRLDAAGNVDTSTALTDAADGSNPRSATSLDGMSLWFTGGAGGIRFTTFGATTSLQLSTTVTNLRQGDIFAGQLYISTASGSAVRLGTVGTGLPTTAAQTITNIPGFPGGGSPYGFFFADVDPGTPGVDVLYVADDSTGLTKYSLVSGTWTANGTLGTGADAYRGVAGVTNGAGGQVTLFATRHGGSTGTGGGELVIIGDPSGIGGAFGGTAAAVIATAPANTSFRGVALAPR
jgi:hypothetical protein